MKQRVITALVGLVIFFLVMTFYSTWLLNISAACIIALALWELFNVTKVWQDKLLSVTCLAFGVAMPFFTAQQVAKWGFYYHAFFAFCLFCILLYHHQSLDYSKAAVAYTATSVISTTISMLIWVREISSDNVVGIYYTLLIFGMAWLTDTGAYLFGITMGKHKMAPQISPKKTVEGAVGGVLFCLSTVFLLTMAYHWICIRFWNITLEINYLYLLILTLLASGVSMLGDLSASLVKRQCHVKDYGSIMPGHGGIMDRFDSVYFVIPLAYLFIKLFPLV